MVELYLKATNQQVKVGDKIKINIPTETTFGKGMCQVTTVITPDNIPELINKGFIYAKNTKHKVNTEKEIDELTPKIVDILSKAVDEIAMLFHEQVERMVNGK